MSDTLETSMAVAVESVYYLFTQYDFDILQAPDKTKQTQILIGEHLSTRLNENKDEFPTGSIRLIIEPIQGTNNIIIRARWYSPMRKGYEEKKKRQEEENQKKFQNFLSFHIKHFQNKVIPSK